MPRRRSNWSLLLVGAALTAAALVLLVAAGPASAACRNVARWVPDFSGQSGGSLQLVLVCDGEPAAGGKPKPAKGEPTVKQRRTLRFEPRQSVTKTVRQRLVEQLAKGPDATVIAEEINRGRLVGAFHEKLGELGWSREDLVDAYAQAYVLSWIALEPEVDSTSKAVDAAVRADVRRRLGLDASYRRMTDGKQQALAEWLGAWSIVIVNSANSIQARDDTASFATFRREAAQMLAARELLGEDIRNVKLTRKGIERR